MTSCRSPIVMFVEGLTVLEKICVEKLRDLSDAMCDFPGHVMQSLSSSVDSSGTSSCSSFTVNFYV
jgi:hypothetical protein